MKYLSLALVIALSSCSGTTVEQRDAYRETAVILAMTAIEVIKDVGLGPDEIDPKVVKIVNGACKLFRAGGPMIVLVINTKVAEYNANALEGEATELVTAAEYSKSLNAGCDLIAALLEPIEPALMLVPEPVAEPDV